MQAKLNTPETLTPAGRYTTSQWENMMVPRAETVKHFVGTIEIPGIARGTACLLENGCILTCLHNIIDYKALEKGKAELIDFNKYNVSLYFVKDDNIYKYRINDTYSIGLEKLKAYGMQAMCFDYALLGTDGNPVRDLGGGFRPDDANYFSSLLATEPSRTLAISGPFLTRTNRGIQAHRYVSLSENEAAQSQQYHITQSGNHPSAPGFSGMAIVPTAKRDNTLYAIHSYRDNQGQQTGTKISEIRSAMRDNVTARKDYRLDPYVYDILTSWFEVLTKAKTKMDGTVERGAEITFDQAVKELEQGRDIAGDNKKEAQDVANRAWGKYGKLITDPVHVGTPKGQPHFHDAKRQFGHAFYPSAAQQAEKLRFANEAKRAEQERLRKQQAELEAQAKEADSGEGKAKSQADQVLQNRQAKKSGQNFGRK